MEIEEAKKAEQNQLHQGSQKQVSIKGFVVSGRVCVPSDSSIHHCHFISQAPHYPAGRVRGRMVCFATSCNLSFKALGSLAFHELLKELNPHAEGVTGAMIRNNIMETWEHGKEELRKLLKVSCGLHCSAVRVSNLSFQENTSCYSISYDEWTSSNTIDFVAINIHFVDKDWTARRFLLDFKQLPGGHTGVELVVTLVDILEDYGIAGKVSFWSILVWCGCDFISFSDSRPHNRQHCIQRRVHLGTGAHSHVQTSGFHFHHRGRAHGMSGARVQPGGKGPRLWRQDR